MYSELSYRVTDHSVTCSAAGCIARFRDAERIAGYCRECPNYGRMWGCPPLSFEVGPTLGNYEHVLIVATRIEPLATDLPLSAAFRLIRPERLRLEERLLALECHTSGRAFTCVGQCLHCPEGSCTRPQGLPCRHPERIRPSLEACGFDLVRMARELFGIEMQWSRDGRMPAYLTLVCGLFHNGEPLAWEPSEGVRPTDDVPSGRAQ